MHIRKSIIWIFTLVFLNNLSFAQSVESTGEMSADAYKNLVNSLGKQNAANLTQQVKQQLGDSKTVPATPTTSQQPVETTMPPQPGNAPVSLQPPTTNIEQPTTPPPIATTTMPPTTQPVIVTTPTTPPVAVPPSQPTIAPPPTTVITPSVAPKGPSYTGFEQYGKPKNTGTNTTPSSGSSNGQNKSSGWKIQY